MIEMIGDLGKGLECRVLGDVWHNVAEITSEVGFEHILDGLQLGSGRVDVDHAWGMELLLVA